MDRGLCLSRTKVKADYDSRGFEPATPVAGQMFPGTTVPWTYEILAYNTWKIKVNFIVSDPETVIMDQFLAPETDP